MSSGTAVARAYQNASAGFSSSRGAGGPTQGCPPLEKTWIGVLVRDLDGTPLPNQDIRVVLDSGQVLSGRTDSRGYVRFENVDPGSGEVTVVGIPEQGQFEGGAAAPAAAAGPSPTLVAAREGPQDSGEDEPLFEPIEVPEEDLAR